MKRVNVRNGLKQRMNEILGTDDGTEGLVPGLTGWSIQSAMLHNLRRIVSALVGDAGFGRPMKGLWLTKNTNTQFQISSGFGFTNNGDIVVLEEPVDVDLLSTANGDRHIYLQHKMAARDGDLYPNDGKKTNFVGKEGYQNIVYDDYAAAGALLDQYGDPIITQSATPVTGDDYVDLGHLTIAANIIDSVTNSDLRGIAPNTPSGAYKLPSAEVTGDVTVGGNMTVEGQILADIIKAEGGSVIDFQSDVLFSSPAIFAEIVTLSATAGKVIVGATPGHSGTIDTAATPKLLVVNGLITGSTT